MYIAEPAVFHPLRAWVESRTGYVADDWVSGGALPPPGTILRRLCPHGDGSLSPERPAGASRGYD
jgi:hypothetical protein